MLISNVIVTEGPLLSHTKILVMRGPEKVYIFSIAKILAGYFIDTMFVEFPGVG